MQMSKNGSIETLLQRRIFHLCFQHETFNAIEKLNEDGKFYIGNHPIVENI